MTKKIDWKFAAGIVAVVIAFIGIMWAFIYYTGPEYRQGVERKEAQHQIEMAKLCHEGGGQYVLKKPDGYAAEGYWCIYNPEDQ